MSSHHGRRVRPIVALLAAISMVLVACGDGETTETTGGTETTATSEVTTSSGAATTIAAETTTTGAQDLRQVQLQLPNSSPSASVVSYYMAQEHGFYAENGLAVELLYGPGSGSAVQQLVSGNVAVASLSPTSMYLAVNEGAELVGIYNHFPENRFGVAVPVDSSIQSIEELEGLAIGISDAGGGEVPTVNAALALAGLEPGVDVELIPVGEGASAVLAIENGDVAALGVSKPDVLVLQLAGLETRMITQEVLARFPGDSLAVTPEILDSERDMLIGLVRGTIQGQIWSQSNPEATHAILKEKYAPEQLADDEFGIPFVTASLRDTATPEGLNPDEHGKFIIESWQSELDLNLELGVITNSISADDILTNEIVEAAWALGIDIDAIRAQAESYSG